MKLRCKSKLVRLIATGRNEKGIVLIAAIALVAILALVGTAAVITTTTDMKISSNYKSSVQAFYAAEAGYNRLIGEYTNSPSNYTTKASATAIGLSTTDPCTANFGSNTAYWFPSVTYGSGNPSAYVDVESYGKILGTNSIAKLKVRIKASASLFNQGIFSDQGVTLSGNGKTDSYNSSTDPTASILLSNGDVGTNKEGAGSISLSGNAKIYGDAMIGPGGNPNTDITTSGNAAVYGNKSAASSPKDMTPMTDPGDGTSETLNINGNNSKTISSGTYRLPNISISGNANGYINGAVILYIDGNISISGNGRLQINSGGSLKIYVSETVSISGNGIANLNSNPKPKDFILYGLSSCTSVAISGNGNLYGAIYAPKATTSITGNGNIYGSVVGKTISIPGNGNVLYDEDLKNFTEGPPSNFKVISWKVIES